MESALVCLGNKLWLVRAFENLEGLRVRVYTGLKSTVIRSYLFRLGKQLSTLRVSILNLEVMQGYGHPAYAASLSESGKPRLLPRTGGWILERPIVGFPYRDAMGCYPLFVCEDWSHLNTDLEQIGTGLVCLSLVTDPFGEYDVNYLRECFPEMTVPFKEHFIIDLSRSPDEFVNDHHRRNARKGLAGVQVEKCTDPIDFLDDWIALYEMLIERHSITGIAAFSRRSFAEQLVLPGIIAFRAVQNGTTVGMVIWCAQGTRSYYHLGAYSPRGYKLRASFALFDYSIRYFVEHEFEWLDLGSGAGVRTSGGSGLNRFKRGWSTGFRTAYFCGRIFDQEKYQEILKTRRLPPTKYFPAYRVGEFR